jgi:prevent-host-death family protein
VATFNVHEAKTQFSRLLDRVLEGEEVVITRNGVAVAQLVPARRRPFPLGAGRNDPAINLAALDSDEWWRPLSDDEVDDFVNGRY